MNVNIIMVFDKKHENILVCKRRKEPYQGLLNLVGGKIESNESGMDAAYRELEEETGITGDDIELRHLMDFVYHITVTNLEVYYGCLNKDVKVYGEENELFWTDVRQDFFDMKIFAGDGNIGHIMEQIRQLENLSTI